MTTTDCLPRIFVVLGFFFYALTTTAQVANDLIENRLLLEINQTIQSNTVDCKVEKSCVNEAQTGKCIKYHNDQWFSIVPSVSQTYYINISGQSCRDLRGVQLVVIDGVPCDTATYQIISCVSLASQDDVFLPLEGLEVGREYLLNIDGYLHDYCDFSIEFGSVPIGLPMINQRLSKLNQQVENQYVNLSWKLAESIRSGVVAFQVYRREAKEIAHSLVQKVSLNGNAFGDVQLEYSVQDTVAKDGYYFYKVVAVLTDGASVVVNETDFEVVLEKEFTAHMIELLLDYEEKTPITILVFNAQTNRLLQSRLFNFDIDHRMISMDMRQWTALDMHQFRIEIVDNDTNETAVLTFSR
jgi:hypothetical protein